MTEILREGSWAEVAVSLRKRLQARGCGATQVLGVGGAIWLRGKNAPGPRLPSRPGVQRAGHRQPRVRWVTVRMPGCWVESLMSQSLSFLICKVGIRIAWTSQLFTSTFGTGSTWYPLLKTEGLCICAVNRQLSSTYYVPGSGCWKCSLEQKRSRLSSCGTPIL